MGAEDQNLGSLGDPATEPVDLAQAFKMLNQANRAAAQGAVEPAEPGDDGDTGGNAPDAGAEQQVPAGEDEPAAPDVPNVGDDLGIGGPADVVQPVDFDARRQQILTGLQQQAMSNVRQRFAKDGIKLCSIEDLYQRDERSGRVTFKNPDDPTHDFSSRAEAQSWVDAFNKQVNMRFRQEVNSEQRALLDQAAPTLRLIDFAPKYDALSQIEKDILDDLIDDYAVRDKGGRVVGYNVDLDAMASRAKKIAQRMPQPATAEPAAPAAPQPTGPALDMKTGASKSKEPQQEPKTIGEALKMYDAQNKKGRAR